MSIHVQKRLQVQVGPSSVLSYIEAGIIDESIEVQEAIKAGAKIEVTVWVDDNGNPRAEAIVQ